MSLPTEAPGTKPSTNGELINRVQQLRLDTQLGRGSGTSRGSWLPWVLCGMMAVTWFGVAARWYRSSDAPGESSAPAATAKQTGTPAVSAGNQPVVPAGALVLQIKGTLTPFLQINLSPDDVAGVVTEIYFKEGDRVKEGQLLARIRNNHYINDLKASEAALEGAKYRLAELDPKSVRPIEIQQAEAELNEAEANRVRAKQDLERYTTQKAASVVSAQDIDKAVADLKAAEHRVIRLKKALEILVEGPRQEKLQSAKADVLNAEARLAECRRLHANCDVRAPINGTILTKVADPGVVVSPMSFNVASGICSMADLSDLEAEIDVREDQISQIKVGQECQVAAMADQNRIYKGRVDRVMPIADDTKNTIKVRVKVLLSKDEEPGSFLKPKMSTVVRIYNTIIPPFRAEKKAEEKTEERKPEEKKSGEKKFE